MGSGVLKIHPSSFLRQLMSMKAVGVSGTLEAVKSLGKFGKFFMGGLWDVYGRSYFK